jgi:hypothetical protein
MTTYNKQQDGNTMYTEYVVKAGETTFKQIAKNHLYGDENRANEIKVMKDGKLVPANQLQTGMLLWLPTTKYKVKAGETTVKQIARDHLHDESRFKEILTVKNGQLAFPDENNLHPNDELLLPPVFASAEESATLKITAFGVEVRSAHDMGASTISKPAMGDSFNYKKSSITKDSNNRVWVEVTLKSGTPSTGWICVKDGQSYCTDPKIG